MATLALGLVAGAAITAAGLVIAAIHRSWLLVYLIPVWLAMFGLSAGLFLTL